jgi:serine phosphatase RsbU (regulator of sigma subunit)/PAS domain-containing protein
MTVMPDDGEISRLTGMIRRQRDELGRMRTEAAARYVEAMARGVLMERLGCSPAEAAGQLAGLAADAELPVTEMAATIMGQESPAARAQPAGQDRYSRTTAAAPELAAAAAELAADGTKLAADLLDQSLAPAGAAAVALWLIEPDGCLELAGQAGFRPAESSRWRRIPPQMDCPARRVAAGGRDLWWSAGPPGGDAVPIAGRWPGGARAVLALRGTRGEMLGVMEICWPAPLADFPAPLRGELTALAKACGQIIGVRLRHGRLAAGPGASWLYGLLEGLLDRVLIARAIRERDGRITDFSIDYLSEGARTMAARSARELTGRTMLEVYPAAALAGGLFECAVKALAAGEPQRMTGPVRAAPADDATVVPVMDVRIVPYSDGVVVTWQQGGEEDRLAALLQYAQRLGSLGGWEENLITGKVRWTDQTFALFGLACEPGAAIPTDILPDAVMAEDAPGIRRFREVLLRERTVTTASFRITRPDDGSVRQMRVAGEPVLDAAGRVVALRGAFQDVSAQYHTLAALAATHEVLLGTEQRAAEERRLALRLQQAIVPGVTEPVVAAGIDAAVRYRPAGEGHLVGGDWYDVILLPTGDVLLVVGDVAGHGIDAVTGMVTARNCLRGLAITETGPAGLLGLLNAAVCHLTNGSIMGTVVCGVYNPASRLLRWAQAGHLPPVLVRGGAASALTPPGGIILGADPGASYEEAATPLQAGDAVLLFTDGLIERRGVPIDEALDALAAIASRPGGSVAQAERYADEILARASSDTSDDACLVAVHIR